MLAEQFDAKKGTALDGAKLISQERGVMKGVCNGWQESL
jgi:hypothetical protein